MSACGAERTTETFSGSVTAQSSASHTITVAAEGDVDATLSSADPAVTVGLGIGQTSSDGTCSFVETNVAAAVGTMVSADVAEGSYCVSVYDVGNIADSVSYSLTVTHP